MNFRKTSALIAAMLMSGSMLTACSAAPLSNSQGSAASTEQAAESTAAASTEQAEESTAAGADTTAAAAGEQAADTTAAASGAEETEDGGMAPASGKEQAASEDDKDLQEIDVVLDWYPNALHAFIYEAIEKGYYAEEGLKVNVQVPTNANDAMSLVAAGQADIGLYYQQDVIQARARQQVPIKSIGAVVQGPLNIVLSLKDKNITSPSDLVGKTVGYSGTELSEALIRSIMENVGADYSDVKLVDVGFDLMSSMTTGNVDATIGCLVNHEVPQMEEEGFEVNYFEMDDYGVPTYYEGIFLASDETIENDSDMLKGFLRASKKGFEDMKNDPEEALKILLDNQNAASFPLSETVERQSIETLLPIMETADAAFLTQTDECWQENIDWMYDQKMIEEKPALDDVRVNLE